MELWPILRRSDLARAKAAIKFIWDKPGYIYREDAYGAPKRGQFSVCAWGRPGAHWCTHQGGREGRKAWGRTQQLGSSREFPSVGATGGALCYKKTVEAHRNGVPVGTIRLRGREAQGDRVRAARSLARRAQYRQSGAVPRQTAAIVSRALDSCVSFVNSPMVEPAAVVVLVTPRNSFFNGCPSVTCVFRRQVSNGLALICAALYSLGRAGQGRAGHGMRDIPCVLVCVCVGGGGRRKEKRVPLMSGHCHGQM